MYVSMVVCGLVGAGAIKTVTTPETRARWTAAPHLPTRVLAPGGASGPSHESLVRVAHSFPRADRTLTRAVARDGRGSAVDDTREVFMLFASPVEHDSTTLRDTFHILSNTCVKCQEFTSERCGVKVKRPDIETSTFESSENTETDVSPPVKVVSCLSDPVRRALSRRG